MKKLFKAALALAMASTLAACSSTPKGSDTLKGTYSINIIGEDYGCGINKAVVTLDYVLDEVTKDTFTVVETKKTTDWTDPELAEKELEFPRTIKDAYLCDENGNKVEEASKYVALELQTNPNEGSPFTYSVFTGFNTWCNPYYLTISLAEGKTVTSAGKEVTSFTVDTAYTSRTTSADMFKTETRKFGEYDYNVATYTPEGGSDTLFVWLHGAGEGGSGTQGEATNVEVTLLANKVTALAGEDFQTTLGGCNVLVPQCPTYWMDNGSGAIAGDRTCIYTESLHELINTYAQEMGATKVAIGGCSNGGYMTMLLAMDYGKEYQAYVPICEAMADAHISDKDIETLKELPLYFIWSKDDTTVDPTAFEIPTTARLEKAGATNMHISTTEHVEDLSGAYDYINGSTYTYAGHWSWIYFDNDQTADANGVSAFDWLAETLK